MKKDVVSHNSYIININIYVSFSMLLKKISVKIDFSRTLWRSLIYNIHSILITLCVRCTTENDVSPDRYP